MRLLPLKIGTHILEYYRMYIIQLFDFFRFIWVQYKPISENGTKMDPSDTKMNIFFRYACCSIKLHRIID